MNRPGWDQYFLGIAQAVSARADCTRRKVGAVIVKDRRIVSTGYNGAASGEGSCLAGDCPRGRHYPVDAVFYVTVNAQGMTMPIKGGNECACGSNEWPCPEAVEPGSSYDTGAGSCIAIHSELNALLFSDRDKCEGATIYVTAEPCDGCMRAIKGAGIARAVWVFEDSTRSWTREGWPWKSTGTQL